MGSLRVVRANADDSTRPKSLRPKDDGIASDKTIFIQRTPSVASLSIAWSSRKLLVPRCVLFCYSLSRSPLAGPCGDEVSTANLHAGGMDDRS